MTPHERFERLREWLIDDIDNGRADAAYWLTIALVRLRLAA